MPNDEEEMKCIPVDSLEQQLSIGQKMRVMQITHNALAADFEILVLIARENQSQPERIKPLIRACIKELFSLVESDVYLINQYRPYEGFKERDNIGTKFKRTYRHHARGFDKEAIKKAFQERFYRRLYQLKMKRDEIVHPKGDESIEVSIADLEEVVYVFTAYRSFIIQLMTNIGFSTILTSRF